eukprot:GHRR01013785.1.p1 GENE.GHRR01013785.1~~GHRR01013785.1.p1  ORF type:complete len:724 (+),score=288.83 GHRR01013785.1:145-2316(+)
MSSAKSTFRLRGWLVWLVVVLAIVEGQTEHPVTGFADQEGQRQLQQQQQQYQHVAEHVGAPTVHLRQPGIHAPAPSLPGRTGSSLLQQSRHAVQPGAAHLAIRPRVPLLAVVVMSICMCLMSCVGVLPYFFMNKLSKPWAGLANATASGVMLTASFGLLAEGAPYGGGYLIAGMLLGVLFVKLSQEHLEQYEVGSFEQLAGADARKVILFLAVMAVHAVGEGGGVGVSFAGQRGWAQGTLVTLAIGLHNVPEGLAVATVMAAKGTPPSRTLLWTALTALPQALVAPPAFVFVDTFKAMLPLAMGFAAGCMIWIVLAELLPDALEAVEAERVATFATGSAAWLQALSVFIAQLETPAGTLASPFGDYKQVLPLGLGPLLLHLLPLSCCPAAVAALAAQVQWYQPLAVSAAAGLLASYCGVCWLQLLVGSPHPFTHGLLMPIMGAAIAAVLWQHVSKAQSSQSGPLPVEGRQCRHEADLYSHTSMENNGVAGHHLGSCQGHQQQQPYGSRCTMSTAEQVYQQPYTGSSQLALQQLGVEQVRQRHSSNDGGLVVSEPHSEASGSPNSSCHGGKWQQQQRQQWPHAAARAYLAAGHNQPPIGNSLHEKGCKGYSSPLFRGSSPLPLPGTGNLVLPVAGVASRADGSSSRWWLAGPSGSSSKGHKGILDSRHDVDSACTLALGGVVGLGGPLGLQLAGALAAVPGHMGHVVLPMLLLGRCISCTQEHR